LKITCALLWLTVAAVQQTASAAYSEANSPPVTVMQIYANEYGSPYVYVSGGLDAACVGNGLYLYDITQTQPNWNYRNNKMAMLLKAQAAGSQVVLDYFYDPTVSGWSACYISGISLVN
jgi:hypothetical protein